MTGIWLAVVVCFAAIHLAVICRAILLENREPYSRAAWLFLLIALPGFATILYLLFGEPWISRAFRKRSRQVYEDLLPYVPTAGSLDSVHLNAFRTCEAVSRWRTAAGNVARVAADSDSAIDMIVADIDAAQRSVHLSFYIWLGDHNGRKMVEAVCRAARRGVACRIVADAIGSHALIRSGHWQAMREAGAQLCASLKAPFDIGLLAGHRTDLRNHRKVVVIDGA